MLKREALTVTNVSRQANNFHENNQMVESVRKKKQSE